jgi:hypothetical protein
VLIGYCRKFLRSVISQLNSDFDHMFGLVNGFCDQKSEQSELNWPINQKLNIQTLQNLAVMIVKNL